MDTKQQKINDLKKRYEANLKKDISLLSIKCALPETSKNATVFDSNGFHASIDCQDPKELCMLLNELKPVKLSSCFKHGQKTIELNTPYQITTISNVRQYPKVSFVWDVLIDGEAVKIDAKIDAKFLIDEGYLTVGFRGVTDSEHHYFGGCSMREINSMQIPCANFSSIRKQVGYYGGDKRSTCTNQIESMAAWVKKTFE